MLKLRLEMGFKDEEGKNYKLSIDQPREDIEAGDVKNTMDLILDKDVFRNQNNILVALDKARIIRTEVTDIPLE